ncbi:MAG: ABC transporter substrate-binding protein [Actinobacteria bacterium]|nr:ABC transporter substrate-binding protein [Actinomycetota bacterium]
MQDPDKGMDRRDFLAKTAAVGVVATGALSAAGPAFARTLAPSKLKTVRYAMSGGLTPADLADPAFSNTQHDGRLMTAVYEQLTRYDESLQARPWLAERWDSNKKGDVWTFTLRSGVRFHDGSPLTAKDVVYSFRRLLDPKTKSPSAGLLSFIDPTGIKAVGARRVSFKLKQAIADFPLALITKSSYIVKDGATSDELKLEANGTGAFMLKEFQPGDDPTIFVRNKRYWGAGLPRADVLRLVSISEPAARIAALKRGQVDIIENPPGSEVPGLQGGNTRVVVQVKGDMELVAMQIDQEPFDDNRVRDAMKYALDRQRMARLVAQGRGTIVNDIPIASFLQYALPGPARAHDIAKAKALLKQAGYGDGLEVTLSVSDVQARFVEWATVYKAMASPAGIDVKLNVTPADTYWDNVWLKDPLFVSAWIARPTDSMLGLIFPSTAAWNETHWKRPSWDTRLAKARRTLDVKARTGLYRQLQQEIVNEGGYLVAYMVNTVSATRRNVKGWRQSGTFFENFATIDIA